MVQTQVLIEIPVPNMAKRLIFSTKRLGRFLISQSGIGLLVCVAMVTFASHLQWKKAELKCILGSTGGGGEIVNLYATMLAAGTCCCNMCAI